MLESIYFEAFEVDYAGGVAQRISLSRLFGGFCQPIGVSGQHGRGRATAIYLQGRRKL